MTPSADTRALLLLTAPLPGCTVPATDRLGGPDLARLLRHLQRLRRRPGDLLGPEGEVLVTGCRALLQRARLQRLLDRAASLGQALERWAERAIWVVSRLDPGYPRRLEARMGDRAPLLLYGCGDRALLGAGGLAVVGSRDVDALGLAYSGATGRLAARAGQVVISGAARGVDRAAMQGASEEGGRVAGVLATGLRQGALSGRERAALREGRLVLLSVQAPEAPFRVGHAMQRNRLIYALADAALVVEAEPGRGGTWAGASEQLDRSLGVPVYVRWGAGTSPGRRALLQKGASPWPEPCGTPELLALLAAVPVRQERLPFPEGPPLGSISPPR